MNNADKIKLAKERLKKMQGVQVNEFGILENKELEALRKDITKLNETIEAGIDVNNLSDIDSTEAVKSFGQTVAKAIEDIRAGITVDNLDKIKLPEPVKEIKISNLKDLPKFPDFKKDFDGLNKAIAQLNKAVSAPKGQTPADYIPVRIVIQPGQQLEFLKTMPIPSFSGGGGSSTPNYHTDTNTYRNIDLDETGQNIKATPGVVTGYFISNLHASAVRYIKFYNKATAPTVGTDTPKLTIPLQPKTAANLSASDHIYFSAGIGIGATTGLADNDTGAPGANDVVVNILYY